MRLWALQADGRWQLRNCLISRGLDVIDETESGGLLSYWRLRRSDGQTFESAVDALGRRCLADPVAYDWLWFSGMDATGNWISVPAIDVPPEWIEWEDDGRTIRVSRHIRNAAGDGSAARTDSG